MHDTLNPHQLYMTVDLILLTVREGRLILLLSQRTHPPYAGRWALPGRFVGIGESAMESAGKLLQEMLPLQDAYMEQLFTFTQVDRDPRGRVISCAYLVIAPWGRLEATLKQRQTSFQCFRADLVEGSLRLTSDDGQALRREELAFDHARILETSIQRLRGKIDYTDIGFHFLENPDRFSLGELQTVFEAILGIRLDDSNFRRGILNRYERTGCLQQTDQVEKRRRGRPAALYRIITGGHAPQPRER